MRAKPAVSEIEPTDAVAKTCSLPPSLEAFFTELAQRWHEHPALQTERNTLLDRSIVQVNEIAHLRWELSNSCERSAAAGAELRCWSFDEVIAGSRQGFAGMARGNLNSAALE